MGSTIKLKYVVPAAISAILGLSMFFMREGTFVLAIICMFFSFLGMIYCARRQKFYAYAQPVAVTLLVVILLCMVLILIKTMNPGNVSLLIENEIKYAKAGAYMMGKQLSKKYAKKKALIIAPQKWRENRRILEIISGLKQGIDGKIKIKEVATPIVPKLKKQAKGMPEDYYMFGDMVQAEHYNKLIDQHKDCKLLIFLSGLPHDMVNLNIWEKTEDERPMVALLYGDVFNLKRAIKAGYITVLSYKPDVKFSEAAAPSDYKKAFDERYLIITPENIEKLNKKYNGFLEDVK